MDVKTTKEARARATRESLVRGARELFAANGYQDTATEEIVGQANVTRGALYHHFRDKRDLFEAVVEHVEEEIMARLAAVVGAGGDPLDALRAGCRAFLDLCRERDVRQIIMLDAPAVLGWAKWRSIDMKYGLGLVRASLEAAMEADLVERQPVEPLAHLLLGAVSEAAMVVAHADDDGRTRKEVAESCDRLILRLRLRPSESAGAPRATEA